MKKGKPLAAETCESSKKKKKSRTLSKFAGMREGLNNNNLLEERLEAQLAVLSGGKLTVLETGGEKREKKRGFSQISPRSP